MAHRFGIRPELPAPHPLLSERVQRGGMRVKKKSRGVVTRDALPGREGVRPRMIYGRGEASVA